MSPTVATPSPKELTAQWALWSIEGLGPKRLQALLARYDRSLSSLWSMTHAQQTQEAQSWGYSAKITSQCLDVLQQDPALLWQAELSALGQAGHLLHISHSSYPAKLLDLPDPPLFLSVKGSLTRLSAPLSVALVGSRHVPQHQKQSAHRFAKALVQHGAVLISGGALGMDTAAHQAAKQGETVAVMPGGHGHWTPKSNHHLFDSILDQGGALMTEYPFHVPPKKYHFPRRNRLIAAMASALVLLKARQKGGTMLTAIAAQDIGRPIYVLPYAWEDQSAYGGLTLVRDGKAQISFSPKMLCSAPQSEVAAPVQASLPLASPQIPEEAKPLVSLFRRLSLDEQGALSGDDIAHHMTWSSSQMWHNLMVAEINGWLTKIPGAHRYHLSHSEWLIM